MNDHALEVLEFERVLERVARRASSELGRDRVRSLRPRSDRDAIVRELARVDATVRFRGERPDWGLGPIPDARHEGIAEPLPGAMARTPDAATSEPGPAPEG